MSDDYNIRVLIERLARKGASEKQIERAVRDALRGDDVAALEREKHDRWSLLRRAA